MKLSARRLRPLAAIFAFLLPISAHAATAQFRVLFDVDHTASTGCTVGGMAGVDQVLDTAITYTETSGTVTGVTRRACVNGVLAEPVLVSQGGWPVGIEGSSGNIVVETSVPVAAFGTTYPFNMRIGFAGAVGTATAELLVRPNDTAIIWPEPQQGTSRRRASAGGTAPTMRTIVMDGATHDWGTIEPEAVGANNGNSAVRLTKVYAYADDQTFSFRFDARVSANAPVAADDTYSVRQGKTLNVAAPGVLINDSDPNGGALTATAVTAPPHGNLTLRPDGGFIYINDGVLVPDDTFEYKASNGSVDSNVAKVKINITPNAQPRAIADTYNVAHRGTITIPAPGVLVNDTDADADPLRAQLTTPPQNGSLTLNADGSFTYTHNGSNTLQDTFSYRVNDGISNSNPTTVTLTIAADLAPVGVADAYSLAEGATLDVAAPGVLANDTDADTPAQFRTAVLVTGPANGTLTLNANGSFQYVHNGGETTTDTFTYRVNDGIVSSSPVTVTLSITPINDVPVAVADAYSTNEDTTLTVPVNGVLANDTDAEGQALTATVVSGTTNGTLTLNANGSFNYVPNANTNGTDTFTYTVTDGTNTSAPATVTITVNAVNDAPVNTVAPVTTSEDNQVGLGSPTVADVDAGSGSLNVTLTATNGTLWRNVPVLPHSPQPTLTLGGTLEQVNAALANVYFVPTANYNGAATVTMVTTDNGNTGNGGAQSDTDVINITITAVNDLPSFTVPAAAGAVNEDAGAQTVPNFATGVSAGPADESGQTLTFNTTIASADPTLTFSVAPSINAAGTLTYTAAPNAYGTATVSVTLSDNGAAPNTSAAQTFTITVNPVNDEPAFTIAGNPPTINEDAGAQTVNGFASAISLGANETGQTATFNVTQTGGTLTFTGAPQIDPSGNLTYTAAPNAFGTATFNVVLTDSGSNTAPNDNTSVTRSFTITVNSVNDAPVVNSSNTVTFVEGAGPIVLNGSIAIGDVDSSMLQSASVLLTGNADANDVLACPACAGLGLTPSFTAGSGLTITGSATVANYETALRSVTLTNATDAPVLAPRGIDWFVTDNGGLQSADTANNDTTVNITATNDAPVNTMPAAQLTAEDVVLPLSGANAIVISDPDAAGADVQITLNVTNGIVTLDATATGALTSVTGDGSSTVIAVGTVAELNAALDGMTFAGNADYHGPASIQIVTNDLGNSPGSALSDTDTLTITVTEVNDAPVATNDTRNAVEDTPLVFAATDLSANDSTGPANESGQTRTVTAVSAASAQGGTVTLVAGNITYTPAADFFGTDTFTYTLTDNGTTNGAADPQSTTGTVTVTVSEVNDAPAATNDAQNAVEDTPLAFAASTLTANDSKGPASESSQTLTVTGVSAASAQGGTVTLVSGTITYTPPANYFGTDSFTYTVTDNGTTAGASDPKSATGTVNVTVSSVNDAAVLTVTGAVTHTEGAGATNVATAASINDVDDTNIESATVVISANYAGAEDVLSFVNTANITGSLVGNTLTLTGTDTIANYVTALQSVTYTNTSDTPSTLQRTISWSVNDGDGNSNTQATTLDVTATNDAPVNAVPAPQVVAEEAPLTFGSAGSNAISIADADAGSDDVQVTLNVANGTVTLNSGALAPLTSVTGNGSATVVATGTIAEINAALDGLSFTATTNYNGAASIQIVTSDLGHNPGGAQSDTDTVSISVTAVNDAPVLTVTGTPSFTENGSAVALASAVGVTDVDDANIESSTVTLTNAQTGDVLNFVNTPNITGNFAGGVLTLTGSDTKAAYVAALQSITFSNPSDNLSAVQRSISWVVNDGDTNSNTQTTTVDVTATNDAPVNTVASGLAVSEDTPLVINGASIADADADPDDVQITLNVTSGTLTLDATATGALTSLTGDGTATVVAVGTVAEINAALSGMTFTPSLDFSGTASIQMVTNDLGHNPSGALSDTDSFNITVNNVNDPAVLTVTGAPTFAENGSAVALSSSVNLTDVDNANMASATITITNVQAGDVLSFVNTANITGNYAAGVLTLTGSDTKAAYVAALQSITFSNASDNPSITQRSISWVVNDGGVNSNTQTTTLDVTATNDAPVNTVAAGLATNEDTSLVINGASIADPDADPDAVQITLNVTGGTVSLDPTATGALASLTGNGTATVVATGTVAQLNAALSGMTFTPTANFNGTASIQMVTDDLGNNPSGAITDTDSFNITVNAVNDPPSFTAGANVNINEDHGAYSESAWATAISAGPADENGQGLSMNSSVTGTTGTLSFSQVPSVNVVTGNLTFQANANTCGTATVQITLTDDAGTVGAPGDDLNSAVHTLTISVACVNDAPSFTPGANQSVNEDAGAQTVNPWATGISPGAGETDLLNFTVSNDNNPLFSSQPVISPSGVLTYTPAANAHGVATVSVTLTDDGGTPGVPADDLSVGPVTFTITVTAVNDPPTFTVQEPGFIVLGTTGAQTATVATAISAGAPNESGQALTFNVTGNSNPALFSAGPTIAADGTLSWTPAPGVHGTSLITITLSDDNGTAGVPADDQTSAPQSFTIVIERGPTVDSTTPLEGAQTVTPGDNIVLNFSEAVTYESGAFTINCGGNVAFTTAAGPASTYTLDPTGNMPGGPCTVTVVASKIHDVDTYDAPDTLATDFTLNFTVNTPPTAVDDSTTALGGVTLTVADAQGVLVNDTDPDAGAVLTVDLTGNPFTTSQGGTITFTAGGGYTYNAQAMDQNVTDTVNYTVKDQFGGSDTGTLSINVGPRFIYVDDDHPTATPDGRDIHPWKTMQQAQANSAANDTILVKAGSYTDHIVLQSGQNLIGQGISANLTQTHNAVNFTVLTAGAAPAISRAAAGDTITLSANNTIRGLNVASTNGKGIAGSNFTAVTINDNVSVNSNGNAALHLDTGAVMATLNSVSAAAGANSGLIFNALTGTLNINAGTISNTAGATLNLTGGSMTGTIAANFSTTGSSLINIASRTANALTLSGTLSGSGTIAASGNAAGTTLTFSGTQTLNTGASIGVNLSANPGTVSFTGGALQITTTSGSGFIASGATGNVNVTGAGNSITATSGIPLQMTGGVDIGASGVTFRSISANGAVGGIVLADTGSNSFTLSGNGALGSGGTLQSIVGSAVSLTNTSNVNLNYLTVSGAGTGISGTTFGTLTLRDLSITAAAALSLNSGTVNDAPAATAFSSISSTGGVNGVAMTAVAGSFNVSAGTRSGASGATFLVNGGSVSGTWSGNITQGNAAAAMDISNGHTGALIFAGTVTATNGTGLQFNNADGSYNFSGAAVLSGGAGIDVIGGSSGTFSWDADSSIGNSAAELIDIRASAPTFTYSGSFNKVNAGRGIYALNNTGGTITINGTGTKSINVNSGAAHAIELDNNDGSTISFSGNNLTLTTVTGNGFHAVNGGTVSVAGTNNTVTTSGGAAVNIAGTTIAGANVNFKTITATGGVNAIVLNNTGASGSLIILGDGSTTQNATGGTLSGQTGDAILLTSTLSPSFSHMSIQSSGLSGVKGKDVTNFTFNYGTINNSGTASGTGASNIYFGETVYGTPVGGEKNLTGTVSIVGNSLNNAYYHGVHILNYDGTITDLQINNNTMTSSTSAAASNGTGVHIVDFGTSTTVSSITKGSINGNTFTNWPSQGAVSLQVGNATAGGPASGNWGTPGSATNIITIDNNFAVGDATVKMGTTAILVANAGTGVANVSVSNNGSAANKIRNTIGTTIGISVKGNATLHAAVNGNYVDSNNGLSANGIALGGAAQFGTSDVPTLVATVNNNVITNTSGVGLYALMGGCNGKMKVTIQSNNVGPSTGAGNRPAIRVDAGNSATDDTNVCATITGNTATGVGSFAGFGVGVRKQGTVQTVNDFAIIGAPGPTPISQANVASYLSAQNTGGAIVISGDNFNNTCPF